MVDELKLTPLKEYVAMKNDNANLLLALQEMEHAVNLSVSGQKVDVGEWLRLINQANAALGDRSLSK